MRKEYTAEIISIGTELLLGQITNTDARDIAQRLARIGINVLYTTEVGDNPERLARCIEIAKERVDIIITTAGLGPTVDDLTKVLLAKSFGLELVMDEKEKEGLYDYITNEGYSEDMSRNNLQQAMLPEGCTVFHNYWGTAPGCAFQKDGKVVLMFPGPPKECIPMFDQYGIPYLKQFSDEEIFSHEIRVFGTSESAMDFMMRDIMKDLTNPSMAPYAKEADCFLRVTAKAGSEEEAEAMMKPVIEKAVEILGDNVYGFDISCVEERVFQLMQEQKKTFATAESCTGGMLSSQLVDIPGASDVLGEAHTEEELELAATADLAGVNARDLRTFSTSLERSAALIAKLRGCGKPVVAESAVRTNEDIRMLRGAGATGFLIGETLMRAADPGAKLKELLSCC